MTVHDETELDRLRALVGPSETGYVELRTDRDEAQRVAREAVHEAGALRGQLTEVGVQLSRARQEQDLLMRRSEMSGPQRVLDRAGQLWSVSIAPRLRRFVRRSS